MIDPRGKMALEAVPLDFGESWASGDLGRVTLVACRRSGTPSTSAIPDLTMRGGRRNLIKKETRDLLAIATGMTGRNSVSLRITRSNTH